jgi:hypothetical protein
MSNVVQLEAFEAPLRSRRIRWFLSPGTPITYPPGFQEQLFLETPPFQRRILLTTSASSRGVEIGGSLGWCASSSYKCRLAARTHNLYESTIARISDYNTRSQTSSRVFHKMSNARVEGSQPLFIFRH